MPKSEVVIIVDPKGCALYANMDNRYGRERICLNIKAAIDMARLDDIIEKQGILPGDRVDILCHNNPYNTYSEKCWLSDNPNETTAYFFGAVDNGRFQLFSKYSTDRPRGESTNFILDVRKYPE